MTRSMLVAVASIFAAGCYTSSGMPAFGNLGGPGFHKVDCSRSSGSWAKCHEEADELCADSGGYYVLQQHEDRFGGAPEIGPVVLRTLYIRCFPTASDLVGA